METVCRPYLFRTGLVLQNIKYCVMSCGMKPLVVGISGVTNGGKSMLSERLHKELQNPTFLIKQDDYFYPLDSPFHIPSPGGIPHFNWEVISSLDMTKMLNDLNAAIDKYTNHSDDRSIEKLGNKGIIVVDGFTLYDDPRIRNTCDVKLFLTMSKEICKERRMKRSYDPPDPPGYFDACVWPMYLEHLKRIQQFSDIMFMEGDQNFDNIVDNATKLIYERL